MDRRRVREFCCKTHVVASFVLRYLLYSQLCSKTVIASFVVRHMLQQVFL